MSYNFINDYELIGRYSIQNLENEIQAFAPEAQQYSLGVTKYIWEHSFKLQAEVTMDKLDFVDGSTKNNWYARFQVEIGI